MERDPELPDGFQDADFEMRELYALGARSARLRKLGICDHGWAMCPDTGPAKCLHCDKEFPNKEALYAEQREVLHG